MPVAEIFVLWRAFLLTFSNDAFGSRLIGFHRLARPRPTIPTKPWPPARGDRSMPLLRIPSQRNRTIPHTAPALIHRDLAKGC